MLRFARLRAVGRALSYSTSLSGIAVTLMWCSPAAAQSTNDASASAQGDADQSDREIIVTGSRIARQGFDSPNPVTVLSADDINKLGITDVASVVAQLPQNSQFTTPTNVGAGNFNIGASLANLRGLNPFFGTRTLTMIDTRRFVPTTDGGAVDLNAIPSSLVARVETVTGGASAAYGSDAVAGVVNIILDTKLQGFKGQLDYGVTSRGDGDELHASAAWGTAFAGGRGHFIIGGEYEKDDAIEGCGLARSWCASGPDGGYGQYTNSGYAPTPAGALGPGSPAIPANGLPHYIIGPNSRNYTSTTGLFPFANLQFNADGTALVPFVPGDYANALGFPPTMEGGADASEDSYRNNAIRPLVKHYSALGHAEYDFTDKLTGYVEGSYYRNDATNIQPQDGASVFTAFIQPDNAFLPPGTDTSGAPGTPLFSPIPGFGNFTSDEVLLPPRINQTLTQTYRGVVGLKGDLFSDWGFDAYYTYWRTDTHTTVANSQQNVFFNYALDAVDEGLASGGLANGNIVCRATVPGPAFNPQAAGCQPLNLFGTGNADPAAFAYAYRTLYQDVRYEQQVAAANIHGDLFDGWGAGPIGFAGGVEYRHENIRTTHNLAGEQYPDDSGSYYYDFGRPYGEEYAGKESILEGFAEISIPVLKDVPFFKNLNFDGAIRETRNETTGGTTSSRLEPGVLEPSTSNTVDFTTWKINAVWDVNDWVRLRATRSRDVRAPSFFELYGQSVVNGGPFGSVANPILGTPPFNTDSSLVRLGGSDSNLGPEKADTWTAGIVLTGHGAVSGFQASVDWYQVKLKGPISTLGAQNVVNACYIEGTFCQYLAGTGQISNTGPNGVGTGYTDITEVDSYDLNLGEYTTRGFDIEGAYNTRMGSGSISFRVIASYLYDLIIDPGTGMPVYNYAGVSGPTAAFGYYNTSPKWQGNAFVSYTGGRFTGTIQARYVGSGKYALLDAADGNVPYLAPGDPGYDPTLPQSINENHVDSAIYVNLNASYKLPIGGSDSGRWVEVFGLVNNVFDKKPPVAPGGNGFPTNPVYFDTIGTSFKAGVRIRY